MISRSKSIIFLSSLLVTLFAASACKSESAPKAPKKDGAVNGDDVLAKDPNDDAPPADGAVVSDPLSLDVSNVAALSVKVGTPVSVTFNLTGADGREIFVGMMSSPSGATVSTSGSTVTYSWLTPTGGTYPLKFLLRDRAACEAAETDATACSITSSDTALVAKSYDVASQEFSLVVSTDDSLALPGTAAGNAAGANAGGGNGQMIQQIVGLLGGGGNLAGLLQGLGGGQLQQILSQLQSGGGGGGITQLIGLLGNL